MADRLYRAPEAGALRIEPLGDLTAIFDRRSMQTHLVVAPMPEIIAAMGDTPCDAGALAERLAAMFDLGAAGGDDVAAVLRERLAELAVLGLVAPA
ncbi:HPr-rel-A system PqqD family peptide chaperone [Sphingopyxis terrae]|uniref:HPr-rel-A system PqqD family peptide chaperone n=1 Tax=Sphingopyxis terrae TaxID=33052 RepID=UPI001C2B81F9|nr:HPr-rel-A system PqqD family peptide chaperone [Sphingopyxis terrae]QXF12514.1 HPr-rel-A system PqqD family peptide chaperone [Sphingopyxis terrae subsp. terrae]